MTRAAFIIFGALVLVGLYLSVAFAHTAPSGFAYDPWCCNGGDCATIPATSVHTSPEGYVVTLGPGDHPLKTKTTTFVIPYSKARNSPDGDYHICLWPDEFNDRCFYAGSKAF